PFCVTLNCIWLTDHPQQNRPLCATLKQSREVQCFFNCSCFTLRFGRLFYCHGFARRLPTIMGGNCLAGSCYINHRCKRWPCRWTSFIYFSCTQTKPLNSQTNENQGTQSKPHALTK